MGTELMFRPIGDGYGNGYGYGDGYGTSDGYGTGYGYGNCSPHRGRRTQ